MSSPSSEPASSFINGKKIPATRNFHEVRKENVMP